MTDSEINVAIAEACGWRWDFNDAKEVYWMHSKSLKPQAEPPNYCADLNAMAEVCTTLSVKQQSDFVNALHYDIELKDDPKTQCEIFDVANATARQRAEAFLRTLNLWKD